ncbi:MAG: XRE family transcriptional regulator [Prochlorococcaceae cyanobacterium]
MLLNWRRRNGWTQYTACEWGTEADFEVISYGNLSVIEQGKAGELRQKAFFQLEELNRRLDDEAKKLEGVKTQRLKDQLKDAEPLRGDDDKLWDAVDFWSCYIGYVPVPRAFQAAPAPTLTSKRAEEICQKWRQHVRRVIKEGRLDVSQALEQLVKAAPQEHQKRFSEVLAIDDYSSVELAQLWVDGEEFLPEQWINAWEQRALAA